MKNKSNQNISLFAFIIICFASSITTSQNFRDCKIDSNQFWILEEYDKKLHSGKTPFELFNYGGKIVQILFDRNKKEVSLGYFSDQGMYKYKKINACCIELISEYQKQSSKTIEFIKNAGGKKLLLTDNGEKSIFISIGKKYKKIDGIRSYINDKFFTGKYSCVGDKDRKITFTREGAFSGIQRFNSYHVILTPAPAPRGFDTVILSEIKGGVKNYEYFHWKKEGDRLILYSLTNDDPPFKKIKEKYMELIKIK